MRLAIGLIVSASTVVGPRCPWYEGLKKFMETALLVASYNPAELVSLRANEIQCCGIGNLQPEGSLCTIYRYQAVGKLTTEIGHPNAR
jgi:hypothetical protein